MDESLSKFGVMIVMMKHHVLLLWRHLLHFHNNQEIKL